MILHVHFCAHGVRRSLGVLQSRDGGIVFRYNPEFLTRKIPLSPFMLPLDKREYANPKNALEGLFGVFYDSLPGGWGLLRLDQARQAVTWPAHTPHSLQRLALLGKHGMGALEYTAEHGSDYDFYQDMLANATAHDLDAVAEHALDTARQGPLSIQDASSQAGLDVPRTHLYSRQDRAGGD